MSSLQGSKAKCSFWEENQNCHNSPSLLEWTLNGNINRVHLRQLLQQKHPSATHGEPPLREHSYPAERYFQPTLPNSKVCVDNNEDSRIPYQNSCPTPATHGELAVASDASF
ncbi:hypothetical protein L3X38_010934 [Prunus dulcis]|uniref:Uncharacterized protein n=1 Tax=Prunus dulcis TaxID=3755 RepID=A0AAD4ZF80_PRUDU|nr:hypothetical protein L3X38_010934 [Prunus dulcis]